MQNFLGIAFVWTQTYRQILKSALGYLSSNVWQNPDVENGADIENEHFKQPHIAIELANEIESQYADT